VKLTKFVVIAAAVCAATNMSAQSTGIVISQVYGGGGNSGATLRNDFVELFNRGNTAIDVAGWSVQYASASGSSWVRTVLSGVIQPGQYYLVQEHAQGAGSASLPTPDTSDAIDFSATDGKVALVNNSTNLTGTANPLYLSDLAQPEKRDSGIQRSSGVGR
jgi:predicted extracellular nuclease